MLYTVRPLERIYAQPDVFNPKKDNKPKAVESAQAEYKEVQLPNGRIVTRRDGENYIIEHISSTDMQDYLNDDFVPGKNYMNRGK